MRHFFRWVMKVLILIVVGLISFLTAMRFAIHGREAAVPNFVGMSSAQAEQLAISSGLSLSREDSFYSSEIPIGRVVSQEPAAGSKVRRGWRVRIAESLGPQRVAIPNVVGDSARAAELNLQRRGLDVGNVATISTPELPIDQVVAQSPPPDAVGVVSPKVHILYNAAASSEKTYVMPDFVGAKLAEATVAVTDAGMKLGNVRTVTPAAPAADAASSQAGTAASAAKTTPAAQPAPTGKTPAAPAAKNGAKAAAVPTEGIVVAQSPGAGAKVTTGATINFDIVRK